MNVKTGTQTWSKAEQASSLKTDNTQFLDPKDLDKALGNQNLGEVLNKVADPNWVDPVKARKVGNNQLDKDAFLKLMLAQMKHQDPTNPMQSHEMAAQLAQFTSLEQLNNINSTLETMKNAQSPQTNYQALSFIGKKVSGDSSKLVRAGGDKGHDISVTLGADAADVNVQVTDAEGNVIRTLVQKNLKKGQTAINWNGLDEDGQAARPGEYRFKFEALSATGTKIFTKTDFDGKITGLNFTPEGPVLMVGSQTVRLQDVKKIYEPTAEEQLMDKTPVTPLEATDSAQSKIPAASDDSPKSAINKNIAMSRQILDQLNKAQTQQVKPAPSSAPGSEKGGASGT